MTFSLGQLIVAGVAALAIGVVTTAVALMWIMIREVENE
jgi:hypothetical protein